MLAQDLRRIRHSTACTCGTVTAQALLPMTKRSTAVVQTQILSSNSFQIVGSASRRSNGLVIDGLLASLRPGERIESLSAAKRAAISAFLRTLADEPSPWR